MSELSVDRLRAMLGRETNRAEMAERQMRGMAAELARLKVRIAELESGPCATGRPGILVENPPGVRFSDIVEQAQEDGTLEAVGFVIKDRAPDPA